jgi:hypothetical protein
VLPILTLLQEHHYILQMVQFLPSTLALFIGDTPEADLVRFPIIWTDSVQVSGCGKDYCRICPTTTKQDSENENHDFADNRDRKMVNQWRERKMTNDDCGEQMRGLRKIPNAFANQEYFNEFSGSVPFEWLHNGELGLASYVVVGTFRMIESYDSRKKNQHRDRTRPKEIPAWEQMTANFDQLSHQPGWRGLCFQFILF